MSHGPNLYAMSSFNVVQGSQHCLLCPQHLFLFCLSFCPLNCQSCFSWKTTSGLGWMNPICLCHDGFTLNWVFNAKFWLLCYYNNYCSLHQVMRSMRPYQAVHHLLSYFHISGLVVRRHFILFMSPLINDKNWICSWWLPQKFGYRVWTLLNPTLTVDYNDSWKIFL